MRMSAIFLGFGIIVVGCASYNHFQSIRNETNNTISQVYIKDTGSTDWGGVKNIRARTDSQGIVIRRQNGSVAYWDEFEINNGTQVIFFQETGTSETPKSIPNKDIRVIDKKNISYTKFDVLIQFNTSKDTDIIIMNLPTKTITSSDPIVFTEKDRDPIITVQNNTGFTVRLDTETLANGAKSSFQARRETNKGNYIISYSINDYTFSKEADVSSDAIVILTERPPVLTLINKTGYNLQVFIPFQGGILIDKQLLYPKQSRSVNPLHNIMYQVGNKQYTEQVTLGEADATLTLTKRPPIVTIVNNTGSTINLVQMRIPGESWWNYNILGIQLDNDGITVNLNNASTNANERSGSIVNRDSFSAWLGKVDLSTNVYDIRIDDVQGNSYVQNDVRITNDITLTFSQSDKR